MLYNNFKGKQLSALGLGAMRLPAAGPGYGAPIEYNSAQELIEYAYEHGINFFDTSYFYHNGDSERFLGKVLSGYPRDKWYLSSKLPGNLMQYDGSRLTISGKEISSA
jgi:predicted aldo/keto reductase-like oxidoreductase